MPADTPLDFAPVHADDHLQRDVRALIQLGMQEDFAEAGDVTTLATVAAKAEGVCEIVPRVTGVAAGLVTVPWILETLGCPLQFQALLSDGARFAAQQPLGRLTGNAREILTSERLVLNLLSRMCGVATLTADYVQRLGDLPARLYDTRKTTVGWRRIEKYAVRCGGGHNHRAGLFDAILIKDNHLALASSPATPVATGGESASPAGGAQPIGGLAPSKAIAMARQFLQQREGDRRAKIVEIEVDSLEQLSDALGADPDIVLVDNFSLDQLRQAVAMRDELNPSVQLEASGGVTLDQVAFIGATGVDRISCGAITHQATWLDLGLDWKATR